VIAYLFCVYVLMLAYLASFEQETFASNKKMTILVLILLLTSLLEWVCYLIAPRITPAVFSVMLASLLLSRHVAEIVNVTLAVSLALLTGGSETRCSVRTPSLPWLPCSRRGRRPFWLRSAVKSAAR
jgi:hypothetical protein